MPCQSEKMPSRLAKWMSVRNMPCLWVMTCIRYLVWSRGWVKQAAMDPAAPPSQKGCLLGLDDDILVGVSAGVGAFYGNAGFVDMQAVVLCSVFIDG